jgi:tetratricopeptide (TPR) repeat protein
MRQIPVILILLAFTAGGSGQTQSANSPVQSVSPSSSLAEAEKKLEHGLTQEAIQMLSQLAAAQPPGKGVDRELGIAYYRTGKLIDAEKSFAKAMAEDASDIESIQMRGLTLYRLGRPTEAIPFLERVRQWTPDANADANYVLGLCYMNAQRYDDALKAFAAQYGVDPVSGAARLLAAQMFAHANLTDLASEKAQEAIKLSPNIPLAHFLLGEVALSKSDLPRALEYFEQERAINPSYASVYDRLGDVYTRTGQYQLAQESLTKAISLDQSTTGPFILMGKVFLRRNDPQTALLYLQHAEKMDPGNYITHTLLGQAYRGLGKEEDARRELDTASKIHSDSQLKLQPVQ